MQEQDKASEEQPTQETPRHGPHDPYTQGVPDITFRTEKNLTLFRSPQASIQESSQEPSSQEHPMRCPHDPYTQGVPELTFATERNLTIFKSFQICTRVCIDFMIGD